MCGFAGALYVYLSERLIKKIPIFIMFFLMNVFGFIISVFICKATEPKTVIFSMDPETGCFGFLDPSAFVFAHFVWGLLAIYAGYHAYLLTLYFYPPQLCTAVMMTEPFLSQVWGVMVGIDKMPGWITFAGALLQVIGIVLIGCGDRRRKKK